MPEDVEKSPAETTPADAKPAKTSRKRLTLVASALVLVSGGAAAAWYLGVLPFGAHHARHAQATAAIEEAEGDAEDAHGHGDAEEGGEGAHGAKGKTGKGAGATLPLDTFIANLADEGGKRYLKTTMQVEFLGDGIPSGIDARVPQIRDLLLTLLTSKSFEEIRTAEGKQQLREEIIARLNQTLDRDAVKAVYFTEFIVQ